MCLMYLSLNKLMHNFNHRVFVFIARQFDQQVLQEYLIAVEYCKFVLEVKIHTISSILYNHYEELQNRNGHYCLYTTNIKEPRISLGWLVTINLVLHELKLSISLCMMKNPKFLGKNLHEPPIIFNKIRRL